MVSTKSYGSTKRFGARYGRRLREKLGEIENEQRSRHKCSYCHSRKVKRLATGIWHCVKCKAKFTGKAYSVSRKITFKREEAIAAPPAKENIEATAGEEKEAV